MNTGLRLNDFNSSVQHFLSNSDKLTVDGLTHLTNLKRKSVNVDVITIANPANRSEAIKDFAKAPERSISILAVLMDVMWLYPWFAWIGEWKAME